MKQRSLFTEGDTTAISIEDAANRTGVSTATIRNWIKTKYLEQSGKGTISIASLEKFESEISGIEKLTQRANKSNKDEHNHDALASMIISKISSSKSSLDEIGSEYEDALSDSYRNKEGIYYTPRDVISDLFQKPEEDLSNMYFCDPCCGSGNFVVQAIRHGFKPENIYAYDTDTVAVEVTKARIYKLTGYQSNTVQVADYLELATDVTSRKYDYIFTNPPWGKKLAKELRRVKGVELGAGASIDTCSIFFFACLATLNENGRLGLLLPDSFFNIAVFEDARKKAIQLKIERLVDYGKAFKGLVSKAEAIVIRNIEVESGSEIECQLNTQKYSRKHLSFANNPKSILNFHCSSQEAEVLQYLLSMPHITLKNKAKWALGIVTGNNKKHVREKTGKGLVPVFKGADITIEGLKSPSSYFSSDFNAYQQVAPMSLYQAEEKLAYKFISSRLCFFYDDQKRFFLNSANMLLPDSDFPVSSKILGQYLSSDFMNWVFEKIFKTHKILRADLESLPIFHEALRSDHEFDEEELLIELGVEKENGTYRIKNENN